MTTERRDQIAAGLSTVRHRIAQAAEASGRAPEDVSLVVVTKFFPESDVRLLHALGVRTVGENRHQEAAAKAAACSDLDLAWHFIGGLQSNKAAAVTEYASCVESVDRAKLVGPLARGAVERGREVDVLLQVSLDPPGAQGRSGCDPEQLAALAERVVGAEGLRLRGLMGVAPLGEDPGEAFARLARVRARFLDDHPQSGWLSAGMSGDLEQAIAVGATHVRVGSAILGARPVIK